ncbi:MAG: hypothetical protein QM622_03295 [Microbacterium sp.]
MAPTRHARAMLAGAVAIGLLAAGAGVGVAVGDALGIRTEASAPMEAVDAVAADSAATAPPPEITVVDAPSGDRFALAVDTLRAATDAETTEGTATLSVTVTGTADIDDDTYTLSGTREALVVTAATDAGAVRGVYDLAAQLRAGEPVDEHLGETVTSRLPFRMVDLGAVGVTADPAQWIDGTDYSHVSRAFADAFSPTAPYVDDEALAAASADWEVFLDEIVAKGYNVVAWPGFLEFVTFDAVSGIYPEGDVHPERARALRAALAPLWQRAADLGVRIYLRTDMPTLTPPLEDYFDERFGGLDTENPQLWQTYSAGLDELYDAVPALSGILIRIGEGGEIYQESGWDLTSALAVRTTDAVQAMLGTYLDQAERTGREVIFRTWSVGIGDVGDMHTDVDSYGAVLDGIDSPALIVSTKYMLGDFYSWLPLNDTLEIGEQRRIVEFQSRREFEAMGSFANDLGTEFQWALQTLLAANPHIEGVWTWTQDGGPWRAGPMILYQKAGFWQFADLNTDLAVALARDPDVEVGEVTRAWARRWFSDDAATLDAIGQAMALSRSAVKDGLYLEDFARVRAFALGLEPPPQMWLFEWDILTGDSATLDVLYSIVGADHIDETIAQGADAVATAERMHDLVAVTDAATWRDAELRDAFTGALAYEADTLTLLAAYREMFLRQAQWHDTADPQTYAQWQSARDAYVALAAAHLDTYQGDTDHPAWNLTAADLGIQRADRDLAMAIVARVLLGLVAAVVIGLAVWRRTPGHGRARAVARALAAGATHPWRAVETVTGLDRRGKVALVVIPGGLLVLSRLVQTSFLAWAHPAIVLGAWAAFVGALLLLRRRVSPWPMLAAVGGVVVLRVVLLLGALAITGPGGYWYAFWVDPARRTLYIAVAFALFVWVFVAAGWALSRQLGRRRAVGVALAAVGAGLAVPAAVVAAIGLEASLTAWNDQLGLLPWGLARILGITTYLEIPAATAVYAAAAGLVIAACGLALAVARQSRVPASVR